MKSTLLVIFSSITLYSYGQNKKNSFRFGQEYELPRDAYTLSSWANNRDGLGFTFIPQGSKKINAAQFDLKSLDMKSEVSIKTSELSKNYVNEQCYEFKENNYWIYSDWDKESEKELLYAVDLGKVAKTGSFAAKLLMENSRLTGVLRTTGTFALKVHGKYRFSRDAEKKLLLVTYRMFPTEKNDKLRKDKIGHTVFDENMNKVWSGEFIMPYTKSVIETLRFAVDQKGSAYMLVKVYDSDTREEINEATGKAAYHFEVLKFTSDGKMSQIPIEVGSYGVGEIYFSENQNHEIAIAFTYTDNFKDKEFKGIFIATVDEKGKLHTSKGGFHNFFQDLSNEKRSRSFTSESLLIQNLLFEKDGSVLIACEIYYIEKGLQQASPSGNRFSRNYNIYHYGNILVCRLSKDGDFEWIKTIPKDQSELAYSGGLGFMLFSNTEGYNFIYNDHKKNTPFPENGTPYKYQAGYAGQLVLSRIDKSGRITKEVLFTNNTEDIFIPVNTFTIMGTSWYNMCETKKDDRKPLLMTVNE